MSSRPALCLTLLTALLALRVSASTANAPAGPVGADQINTCPAECFCLSKSEVLCNTGGLTKIPLDELPTTVKQLTLHKNSFSHIKTEAFAGLRLLRNLSLDHNNITVIKAFAFRGLPRLRELSIQHTPLAVLSAFSFAGLQNLDAVRLSHNRIHRVEGQAFAGTTNVNWLLLDRNPLKVVASKAFSGLTNVKHLIFPSGVSRLEEDAFQGLDHVGLLRLAYMDLVSVDPFTFRGLRHVHVLTIQDSDLGLVRGKVFEGMAHVLNLILKNNKIDALEEFHIVPANKVINLRFEGNHLLQNPAPGAVQIHLAGNLTVTKNHFPCDCRLHAVLFGPLANHSDFRAHNYCIKPLHVNAQAMAAMSSMDAAALARCPEHIWCEEEMPHGFSSCITFKNNFLRSFLVHFPCTYDENVVNSRYHYSL
ncbi:chondroadherin [Thrips palmi]|uniref:Chondroadherin n=1 Tax=Thrips palmi TaxID=161013 RepID=A0A6P8ZMA9_THRPL|nr:chondroadherin [Thrips palmi]